MSATTEVTAPVIGRIAARHQTVARLMALGESTASIAQCTGYSMAHINNLKGDPAFSSLLKGWKKQIQLKFDGISTKIVDAASGTLDEINRRLEFEPQEISTRDLVKTAEVMLDRSGYGPSQTVTVNDLRGEVVKTLVADEDGVLIAPAPSAAAA